MGYRIFDCVDLTYIRGETSHGDVLIDSVLAALRYAARSI